MVLTLENEDTVVIPRDPRSPFFQAGFSPTLASELVHLVEEALIPQGFSLHCLDFSGGQNHKLLRLFIEKSEASQTAVTVGDCAKASSAVGKLLEAKDPIPQAYTLEVSSPGLDRLLVRLRDFKKAQGHIIFLETENPSSEGRKRFHGTLTKVTAEGVEMVVENQTFSISFSQVKKAKLDYFGSDSPTPVKGKKPKSFESKGV